MRIWESIEAHRLDSIGRADFLANSFIGHFNLSLCLLKSEQRLRASNEVVKAAKRYEILLKEDELSLAPAVREDAERHAELLMGIGRSLLDAAPESQRVESCRMYAALMTHLGDANPPSFRHYQGLAPATLAMAVREAGLELEADRSMGRALTALREALDMNGDAVLRDLGQVMRTAIDSFGFEDLHDEYEQLVKREVEYIQWNSPAASKMLEELLDNPEDFRGRFRIT
jgi:hypothetical protein